jgi:glycosyltransferase involved in cell wall biosynthesis
MSLDVLIVEPTGRGGIAQYTELLCSALVDHGVRPHVVTRQGSEVTGGAGRCTIHPLLTAGQPYRDALRRIVRMARVLRPAVVHVQAPLSTRKDAVLLLALRRLGPAVVVTAHNAVPHEGRWIDTLGAWAMYHAADHVVVHNDVTRRAVGARFHIPARRLTVIPHGDYAIFARGAPTREAARAALGIPPDARLIVFFGAVRPYKGLDVLLDAVARLRARRADCRLIVAGTVLVGDVAAYRQQAARLGITDAVTFTDRYLAPADAASHLRAADVAAFPYRHVWESGSLRVAIALGCPVVASDVGGVAEIIRDGETGRLVAPNDPEALARVLAETLADLEGAAARAERALAEERRDRSWTEVAARTAALYRRLTRERAA